MTREEFDKAKLFGGMKMLINGNWKLVKSIEFDTGIHEDSDGNKYPLDSITEYDKPPKKESK